MKKRKLLIAVTIFGLACVEIVGAEGISGCATSQTDHRPCPRRLGDSSSWNGVVDLLLKDGYSVRAVPNTLRGVAATPPWLRRISNPSPARLFWRAIHTAAR